MFFVAAGLFYHRFPFILTWPPIRRTHIQNSLPSGARSQHRMPLRELNQMFARVIIWFVRGVLSSLYCHSPPSATRYSAGKSVCYFVPAGAFAHGHVLFVCRFPIRQWPPPMNHNCQLTCKRPVQVGLFLFLPFLIR